jgi:hypothetical protein
MRQLPYVSRDLSTKRNEYISVTNSFILLLLIDASSSSEHKVMHAKSVQNTLFATDVERRGRVLICGAVPEISLKKENPEKNTKSGYCWI